MKCNFHLNSGIYFRRDGDKLSVVRASDFADAGEVLCETDFSGWASVTASFSDRGETGETFREAMEFLEKQPANR